MYLISHVCPALVRLSLHGKNVNIKHNVQTFRANSFVPTMLAGTIEFCHFILLSVALTSAVDHKGSRKQNQLGSFSHTHLN